MAVTLSLQASLYRSDEFERSLIKRLGLSSKTANIEFSSTYDFTSSPLPVFPIAVPISNATTIKFLVLTVTGGTAVIRLVRNGAYTNSSSTVYVANESPTGTIDGVNSVFTLDHAPIENTEAVYVNGIRQVSGVSNDYTVSGETIIFNGGHVPQTGNTVRVDYYYLVGTVPVPLNTQSIDIPVSGTFIMSEVDFNQLYLMSIPTGYARVSVQGMGL